MRINFTDLIVADHSHSAQGRVHFINAVDAALLVLRVFAGAAFVLHGPWSSQK
jgi:hypothetical protein